MAATGQFLQAAANFGILINCVLLVLNLFPLPPLDGSRVISSILPPGAAHAYEKIEPFGIWILLALLVLGVFGRYLMATDSVIKSFLPIAIASIMEK